MAFDVEVGDVEVDLEKAHDLVEDREAAREDLGAAGLELDCFKISIWLDPLMWRMNCGQPFLSGSGLASPGSLGHASVASGKPSLSASSSGQPFLIVDLVEILGLIRAFVADVRDPVAVAIGERGGSRRPDWAACDLQDRSGRDRCRRGSRRDRCRLRDRRTDRP